MVPDTETWFWLYTSLDTLVELSPVANRTAASFLATLQYAFALILHRKNIRSKVFLLCGAYKHLEAL